MDDIDIGKASKKAKKSCADMATMTTQQLCRHVLQVSNDMVADGKIATGNRSQDNLAFYDIKQMIFKLDLDRKRTLKGLFQRARDDRLAKERGVRLQAKLWAREATNDDGVAIFQHNYLPEWIANTEHYSSLDQYEADEAVLREMLNYVKTMKLKYTYEMKAIDFVLHFMKTEIDWHESDNMTGLFDRDEIGA
eukprot:CAMPEP_0185017432 /NCGR_PEP_ID=MMETSP1103-20130426/391_1 /TAXON_ID=36769 /ORGANISM="Paraphysomonas bandaiensis, Strain Caron Lab Isolate" /LENGTH=192 /DNA_ID=CAMNT_0027546849 /DNA_START=28 /DNA_END=606 /DNA_ORIENTATION=+